MRWLRAALAVTLLAAIPAAAFGQAHFTAKLTGDQEVPGVGTAATGTGSFTLTDAGLQFKITVQGLSGPITAAHIHRAPPGINGAVVRDLPFVASSTTGIWTAGDAQPLTAALLEDLFSGYLYVNVHTAANPGGEIRGQIELSAGVHLTAVLSGTQENPPTGVAGTGTATVILTEEGLSYDFNATGLTGAITAAHIHTGEIGVNGGVLTALDFSGSGGRGSVPPSSFTATNIRDLIAGRTYINLHTAAHPGGEIRGQLFLDAGLAHAAVIDESQEVPPTGAAGTGTAAATLTPLGLQLDISVTGLTGAITGAHIHRGAPGVNGPVVRDLSSAFSGGTASVLWRFDDTQALTPALMGELLQGQLYVNIHTAAFPGGEIRGQLALLRGESFTSFVARLDGDQEEPPSGAAGSGTAFLYLDGSDLHYRITVNGLTGPITGAHFHAGVIGTNGGVVNNITGSFAGNTGSGVWTLTPAEVTELLLGRYYLNVHTGAFPGGEIRGQVLPASGSPLQAVLTDDQENPPTGAAGLGTGSFRLTSSGMVFHFTANNLTGAITGAHFHRGARGVNGGVIRGLALGSEVTGTSGAGVWMPSDAQPLTTAQITNLLRNELYLNLHTAANPGGEIRGQVVLAGGQGLSALLYGGAEVPPTTSEGLGTLSATHVDHGVVYRVTVNDLDGSFTASHFHNAPPGSNGGVVRDLTGEFVALTGDGHWAPWDASPLDIVDRRELALGNIYINVHTTMFPGGEIRGNLSEPVPVSVEDGVPAARIELSAWPNPASSSAFLSFTLPKEGPVRLRLFDASGRLLRTLLDGKAEAGRQQVSLDASQLRNGVYFYRLDTQGGHASEKLLIVR